ncbi:hypothetical protein AB0F81_08345 [Actinoplanes sp. NPDC024001]
MPTVARTVRPTFALPVIFDFLVAVAALPLATAADAADAAVPAG